MPKFYKSVSYTTILISLCCFSLAFMLSACPYSSPYKLDDEPALYADDALMGKWATIITTRFGKQQPVKMIIGKENDNEFSIAFAGYLNELVPYNVVINDSIKGTGFMSTVANRQFMNIKIKDQVYIAEIILEGNKLSVLPMAERFTSKYIKSNAELRMSLEVHFKTRSKPVYDESFCLRGMVRVN